MARDVFISHSARDRAVADAVCAALEAANLRCWVAPRDVRPGHSFAGEITRAIRQSKVMVLIFSSHSNKSDQVLREVQLATDCHLPIVRFRIEDVELTDDLTYFLSTPHWLDALTPPLSKHIASLEIAVKELLGQSAEDRDTNPAITVPPVESIPKQEREIVAEKSSNRWKLLAIAAVVIVAVLAAAVLLQRPAPSAMQKNESTPNPTTQPARIPEPTPSPTLQPAPTAESTPVAALPSLTPKSSNGAKQLNNAGPSPRTNRTWKAWIDDFVHQYVRSSESNDAELATSFFAPTVDLFDEGLKPLDFIRRDTELYNARWPTRRATIRGDVQLSEKVPDRAYAASFEADYYVESATRGEWVNLAVSVDLQIVITDGLPRITSLKQKRLRKEEGKMQPRPAAKTENLSSTPPATLVVASPPPSATTVVSPATSPSAEQTSAAGDPGLIRVTNTRYGFSALIPQNVFPNPQTTFSTDRQIFSSSDGQTTLTLFVQRSDSPHRLRESYEQWAAQRTRTEPGKTVDYKVLRDNWFVVSGEKSGRGFYVKAVAKRDVLAFMHFECDENHYPVSKETLTAMSKSFDGN